MLVSRVIAIVGVLVVSSGLVARAAVEHVIAGTVVDDETGRAVPNAPIRYQTILSSFFGNLSRLGMEGAGGPIITGKADARGNFRFTTAQQPPFYIWAYAPVAHKAG